MAGEGPGPPVEEFHRSWTGPIWTGLVPKKAWRRSAVRTETVDREVLLFVHGYNTASMKESTGSRNSPSTAGIMGFLCRFPFLRERKSLAMYRPGQRTPCS